MPNDKSLREHLVYLLKGDGAHAEFDAVVQNLPAALHGKRPKGAAHSPWEALEHMRITQRDVLEAIRDPKHVSPEFPAGYWPGSPAPPNAAAWNKSADQFRDDLGSILEIVTNAKTDLFAPSGKGQTILRRALLVADHNAYHLAQIVLLRRLLGAWQ
jgi:hypothetical protein